MDVNYIDVGVGGNSDPRLLGSNFNIMDLLIEFPNSDWIFKIRVFPKLDFSVLSSGNKVLSILVNVQSIDWSFMGLEAGLANTELVPDFSISVPRNSDVVGLVWDLSGFHLTDDISVLVLSGGGLDLSLGVPDGSQLIKSRGVDDSAIIRNTTRGDFLLRTLE